MSNALTPVTIPPKVWVDLYDETGIAVGTQLIIQNTGRGQAKLSESELTPTSLIGFNILLSNEYLTSDSSPVGAWAYSSIGTKLQVEEA